MTRRLFRKRIQLVFCPTVREKDGLAMSSRNRFLKPPERARALRLSESLQLGARLIRAGSAPRRAREAMKKHLLAGKGIRLDYLEIADSKTLQKVVQSKNRPSQPLVLAGAVRIGNTRLIDNILI